MEKKITVTIQGDNTIYIDLGGALDLGCCGCPAAELEENLRELGLDLKCVDVHCRLPVMERVVAKVGGICNMNPLLQSNELADFREKNFEV